MAQPSTIPIYADDDLERISDLRREWEIAKRNAQLANKRAGDTTSEDVTAAEATYQDFVAEAVERATLWEIHPIGHAEFRDLLKRHPPRTSVNADGEEVVNPEDAAFGVNVETFGQDLLTFVDADDPEFRTVHAPATDGGDLHKRLKRLTAGEFDTLWIRAYQLNTGGIADPKASLS